MGILCKRSVGIRFRAVDCERSLLSSGELLGSPCSSDLSLQDPRLCQVSIQLLCLARHGSLCCVCSLLCFWALRDHRSPAPRRPTRTQHRGRRGSGRCCKTCGKHLQGKIAMLGPVHSTERRLEVAAARVLCCKAGWQCASTGTAGTALRARRGSCRCALPRLAVVRTPAQSNGMLSEHDDEQQ